MPCGHHPQLLLYDLNEQKWANTSVRALCDSQLIYILEHRNYAYDFRNSNCQSFQLNMDGQSTYQNHEGLSSHYGNLWIQGHFPCPSCYRYQVLINLLVTIQAIKEGHLTKIQGNKTHWVSSRVAFCLKVHSVRLIWSSGAEVTSYKHTVY
jgi:hypothetical protein